MTKLVLAGLSFVFALSTSPARADDTQKPAQKVVVAPKAIAPKVVVLKDYVVYGRNSRPMVVTEVSRLPPASTLSVLRKPLVDRVGQAVSASPF